MRPSYDWDVPTHPNEKFDHCRLCDAPVVTPLPFSVSEYLEYPTCFDARRFCRMRTDWNELKVRDCACKRHDTAVDGWAKRWNHWGDRSPHSCRCIGQVTDSPIVWS